MCIILVQRLNNKNGPNKLNIHISIYTNNEMNWIDQNDNEDEEVEVKGWKKNSQFYRK